MMKIQGPEKMTTDEDKDSEKSDDCTEKTHDRFIIDEPLNYTPAEVSYKT